MKSQTNAQCVELPYEKANYIVVELVLKQTKDERDHTTKWGTL